MTAKVVSGNPAQHDASSTISAVGHITSHHELCEYNGVGGTCRRDCGSAMYTVFSSGVMHSPVGPMSRLCSRGPLSIPGT